MKTSNPRRRGRRTLYLAVVVILAGYSSWAIIRPLPLLTPAVMSRQLSLSTPRASLAWPASQSAVGVTGTSILESRGVQTPVPIASVAKVITALTVLQKRPLALGKQGPLVTLTDQDLAFYRNYAAQDGSLLPVQVGEQISEYQMLQALMLPSANNIADSLAIWGFGSLPAYQAAATNYVKNLGMTDTHIGADASGLAPDSTSTASDLVKLGKVAMRHPVLAQIVGQSTASGIPVAGTIRNVNILLGSNNIIGVKTGNSDQAGGVYLAAAQTLLPGNKTATIITAVVGAPDLFSAMKTSLPLIQSSQHNFRPVTLIRKGAIIGRYSLPWGGSVPVTVNKDFEVTVWNGSTVAATAKLDKITDSTSTGRTVGNLSLAHPYGSASAEIPLLLKSLPTKPSLGWRLTHPF